MHGDHPRVSIPVFKLRAAESRASGLSSLLRYIYLAAARVLASRPHTSRLNASVLALTGLGAPVP